MICGEAEKIEKGDQKKIYADGGGGEKTRKGSVEIYLSRGAETPGGAIRRTMARQCRGNRSLEEPSRWRRRKREPVAVPRTGEGLAGLAATAALCSVEKVRKEENWGKMAKVSPLSPWAVYLLAQWRSWRRISRATIAVTAARLTEVVCS